MVPPESKKPGVWSRVFSQFGNRRSKLSNAEREGSSPAPDLSPPVDAPTPTIHGSQTPVHQSQSDTELHSSHNVASPMAGNQDLLQSPHTFSTVHPNDKRVAPNTDSGTTSFFPRASGVNMRDIQYFEGPHITVHPGAGNTSNDGWERLLKNIASNALHDSSARYDAPKCDEDTRVEVTDEIMDWIQNRDAPQPLLCMTGAAGAGKSALQQTIAERCTKLDILSAAFFCSSTDPTRNTIALIVPTIAYQIGLKHRMFRSSVAAAVEHDPKIFSRSLQSQMDVLIVRPFESLRRSHGFDTNTFPYVILIDGLDECIGSYSTPLHPTPADPDDRRQAEDRQAELLAAIKHSIVDNNLPFRVSIASRPEWAIHTALKPGGYLRQVAYHIELSDKYDASGDMRRYLQRRFEDIGLQIGDPQWFSKNAIEILVQVASGQFVYVATVYKYISERRSSPAERLKVVLTWTPHEGQVVRPFEALDRLYASILSTAKKAYEAVDTHHGHDFLLLFRAYHMVAGAGQCWLSSAELLLFLSVDELSGLLGLETQAKDLLISDLRSLVTFEKQLNDYLHLRLYHKSFSDFLQEESRAKEFFVPESCVWMHLSKRCMQIIIEYPLDFDYPPNQWEELPLPEPHRCSLVIAALQLPFFLDEIASLNHHDVWPKLEKLLLLNMADPNGWFRRGFYWGTWYRDLSIATTDLEAQKPEAAAIIFEFLAKVNRGRQQLDL